ncbi:MAG: hypothetical protein IPJ82_12930 [Lewinellaceae bacterium]|nr:hypothetical protein [Lewinellaceae bacterium]
MSLRILLKYLPEAGLSRPDWIGIQVENKTDHPLKIDGAGYHFDEAVTSTDDKECWNFGRYGSGSVFDLFPFFRQSPNPSDLLKNFFLQPKETVFLSETISDYAAAMLHNRDTATRHIRARLNFQLHNSSEKVDANYPFFFDWSPPEHADRAALKHRLKLRWNASIAAFPIRI